MGSYLSGTMEYTLQVAGIYSRIPFEVKHFYELFYVTSSRDGGMFNELKHGKDTVLSFTPLIIPSFHWLLKPSVTTATIYLLENTDCLMLIFALSAGSDFCQTLAYRLLHAV